MNAQIQHQITSLTQQFNQTLFNTIKITPKIKLTKIKKKKIPT